MTKAAYKLPKRATDGYGIIFEPRTTVLDGLYLTRVGDEKDACKLRLDNKKAMVRTAHVIRRAVMVLPSAAGGAELTLTVAEHDSIMRCKQGYLSSDDEDAEEI